MINKYKLYHFAGYLLLAVIIYFAVDPARLFDDLKKISLPVTMILLVIATIDRFTMAAKWMHLCSALDFSTNFIQYLKIYYVATFLGYCLPTSLGGEVYRAARLSRYEKSHDIVASMLLEKVVAVFSTVSFAWAGVLYITFNFTSEKSAILFYILTGFTVAAFLATWASMHPQLQEKLIHLLDRFRIGKFFGKLTSAYSGYKQHREILFWNFLLAVFESSLQLAILCGIAMTLNIDVPLPILASIIAITEFIRRIAIILDGWGLATALQIFMYSLVGVSVESALLIALLSHAVHMVASLPGGLLMLTDRWGKIQT